MQALQTKSNIGEMFNIQEKENGEIAISGRELHQALEVKTPYKKWFERMSDYGFEENIDYIVTDIFVHNPLGGRQNQTDHALTLDTAKEIAMIQRSEPGKRARQYFIIKRKGVDYNMPTQYSMERELFEIKETSITHSDGHTSISKTPKVTGKGQQYFVNKFLGEKQTS
ncbi:phage antirepressor Ant [Staphylococcus aureus]|nr:phage antirepressor Ant [Staphylococcus aureus]NGK19006.1 phage antirepressor Ant [Staphylococcus aureus]